MDFRPIAAEDIPQLLEATVDNVNWGGTDRLTVKDVLDNSRLSQYATGFRIDRDWGFAAVEEGKVIGLGWVQFFQEESPGYGFVSSDVPELSINIDKDFRRQGFGTQLLEVIVNHARKKDCTSISLSVEDGNPAIKLYEKFGFRPVSREGNSQTMILSI